MRCDPGPGRVTGAEPTSIRPTLGPPSWPPTLPRRQPRTASASGGCGASAPSPPATGAAPARAPPWVRSTPLARCGRLTPSSTWPGGCAARSSTPGTSGPPRPWTTCWPTPSCSSVRAKIESNRAIPGPKRGGSERLCLAGRNSAASRRLLKPLLFLLLLLSSSPPCPRPARRRHPRLPPRPPLLVAPSHPRRRPPVRLALALHAPGPL